MTMPFKLVGDARLSHGARLMLVILWGRSPTRAGKVVLDKRAISTTLNVSLNTMNRYIREATTIGWASYDAGTWWLSEKADEGAA